MKIKKVEIQAFRAYDKVEDGTFDFISPKGKIANFVALYAPNGFGKTSFYDAVEWGITNNISRFLRKKSENKNAAKAEKNKYIWRHNKSSEDTPSFVNIETDEEDKYFSRTLCHKIKSNQRDAKFDEKLTDKNHEYFLDVMLSQEDISAFLKEDDSSLRYEKFTTAFGDSNLDKNYKNITDLVNLNKKKIKIIRDRISEVKLLLNKDVDHNIIKTINDKIKYVNRTGLDLPIVNTNYSSDDDTDFKIKIINTLNDCTSKVSIINEKIEKIDGFVSSDNKYLIVEYDTIKANLLRSKKELENCKIKLSNLEKINLRRRKLSLEEAKRTKISEKHDEVKSLLTKFNQISMIKESLSLLNEEWELLNNNRATEKSELLKFERKLKETKEKSNLAQDRKNNLIYRLENSSFEYKLNNERKARLKSLKNDLDGLKSHIESYKDDSNHKSKFIKINERLLSDFESNIFREELLEFHPLVSDIFEVTQSYFLSMNIYKEKISSIERELVESKNLDSNIKELVEIGSSLVSKNSLSNCPLCSSKYSDFTELLTAIESNKLFNEKEKKLLIEKNNEELEYNRYVELWKSSKYKVINVLKYELEENKKALLELNSKRIDSVNLKQSLESQIKSLQSVIDNFNRETGSNKIEAYEELLNTEIDKFELEISTLSKELNATNELIEGKESSIKIKSVSISHIDEQVKKLQKEPIILKAKSIFGTENLNSISESLVEDLIGRLISDLRYKKDTITNLNSEIEELIVRNGDLTEDELNARVQELRLDIKTNDNKIEVVRNFVEKDIGLNLDNVDEVDLLAYIFKSKTEYNNECHSIHNQIALISSIEEYRKNVIPYLKHTEYFKEHTDLQRELVFLVEHIGKELSKERKNISAFIEKEVQSFFFQDLINKFYKKIDPHPHYKEISFKCDFSTDKPKLHILVSSQENVIVPTLYFSSAQLNALSLSIFLAKAINVRDPESKKPIDSIFVDDPIQAMDSINILSVIDLLRSIAVNFDKQIILSTHDENFYKLLQKKVPNSIFDSKFIELESYGKVGRPSDFSNYL
ncbi:Exonuclease SbcC [Vibrio chagasii]|nr:Exonuclease SbcC [Vibrio chagasii]CAH7428164.1 Exonuclease SbcC [Vibrio chagasii]